MSGQATWITGDTLTVLRAMPAGSVDLVMTSPPFLALRSYLPDDNPAKADEIGQESTPGEFLDVLLDITEELRRVLAPHGSICVELGDTYAGSGGAGGDYGEGGMRDRQGRFDGSKSKAFGTGAAPRPARKRTVGSREHRPEREGTGADGGERTVPLNGGPGWPEDKSLCLIPELYRFALAYGFNPLTGRKTPRWRIRNVVRWVRPNPPVGALGDKFRPGTSEMVVATGIDEAGRRRYFDLDAVREARPNLDVSEGGNMDPRNQRDDSWRRGNKPRSGGVVNPAGAPPLDWWEIPTAPYKGSHYATYPPALCERPIKAMSPQRVCTTCGEPSRRITEAAYVDGKGDAAEAQSWPSGIAGGKGAHSNKDSSLTAAPITIGWTDCGHDTWRPGLVLDPFGGSGTTLAVATGHGRDAIGIDLDRRNVELAERRVGPMFFHHTTVDELWPESGAA